MSSSIYSENFIFILLCPRTGGKMELWSRAHNAMCVRLFGTRESSLSCIKSSCSHHIPFWFILTCSFMWKKAWARKQDKCSSLDRVKDAPSQNLSPGCVPAKCKSTSWEDHASSIFHPLSSHIGEGIRTVIPEQEHLNRKQRWGFSGRERGSGMQCVFRSLLRGLARHEITKFSIESEWPRLHLLEMECLFFHL